MHRVNENGLALDIGMGRRRGRMSVTLSETAEGSVESELALQGRRLRGLRRASSELESLNLFQKRLEEIVIHVGVVPFRHHLSREFLAELHWEIQTQREIGRTMRKMIRGRGEMERYIYSGGGVESISKA